MKCFIEFPSIFLLLTFSFRIQQVVKQQELMTGSSLRRLVGRLFQGRWVLYRAEGLFFYHIRSRNCLGQKLIARDLSQDFRTSRFAVFCLWHFKVRSLTKFLRNRHILKTTTKFTTSTLQRIELALFSRKFCYSVIERRLLRK